ncbi:MAG: Xaa-Pro peptidase family protein [Nitrososphaerota archaeon]|nr:Xaa-Pro peptidase family protein [Candidatus Bathyarchaeota archaeon]MDW8049419.1 Xaa-Pro peptidase family protein [Nitrososphaerota archaeon]
MGDRIEALREKFSCRNLDGFLIMNVKNMQYFTNFSGGSALLIPEDGDCILFVYSVNFEAAKEYARDVCVELLRIGEDLEEILSRRIMSLGLERIGFDTLRADSYLKIKKSLKKRALETGDSMVWDLRKVKDESELQFMMEAAKLASRAMEKAVEILKPGLREREVAAEIEYEMRKAGSEGFAFESIVASGLNSSFPHGGCGERKMKNGDLVVIDIGARVQGYCADLTRTFVIGKPSAKQSEVYRVVEEAQRIAIERIHPGVEAKEVDKKARSLIESKGYGEYFVHNLGHGVGLDVHEPPTIGPRSTDTLSYGNTITIEPGIYIPGFGGVRIEDTLAVLNGKTVKLTKTPIFPLV